jgi:hypothetical protein
MVTWQWIACVLLSERPRPVRDARQRVPTIKMETRLGESRGGGQLLAAAGEAVRAPKQRVPTSIDDTGAEDSMGAVNLAVGTRCSSSVTPPRRWKHDQDGEMTTLKFLSSLRRSNDGSQVRDARQRVPGAHHSRCFNGQSFERDGSFLNCTGAHTLKRAEARAPKAGSCVRRLRSLGTAQEWATDFLGCLLLALVVRMALQLF